MHKDFMFETHCYLIALFCKSDSTYAIRFEMVLPSLKPKKSWFPYFYTKNIVYQSNKIPNQN